MSTVVATNVLEAPRLVVSVDVTEIPDERRRDFIERVTSLLAEYRESSEEEDSAVLGWTRTSFQEALARLEKGTGKAQAAVIRKALSQGGVMSREEVLQTAGYPPSGRSLRGFTQPTNTLLWQMQSAGEVPASAAKLLTPQNSGRAAALVVPAELAALL